LKFIEALFTAGKIKIAAIIIDITKVITPFLLNDLILIYLP